MKSIIRSEILLDLNNPVFQKDLFDLQKPEALAVLKTLKKISQLTWEQLYQDRGLKWEMIYSKKDNTGKLYIALELPKNAEQ